MTYNHEKYIRSCLDGFVMQETNFPFEILVHDDASLDGTAGIVKEYEQKHPGLLRCVYQTENQFSKQNSLTSVLFPMVKGKYIALCEGDDFWTDQNKLQKQVDILEQNPHFSFCFHSVEIKNEVSDIEYSYPVPKNNILVFKDILHKHYIATCSLLFRFSFLTYPLPDWFSLSKIGDVPIELMLADNGPAFFINEKMACYRRNVNSLTSSKEQIRNGRKIYLFVYKNLNRQFNYRYWHLFGLKILRIYLGYFKDIITRRRSEGF